jgi:hypothetical protein
MKKLFILLCAAFSFLSIISAQVCAGTSIDAKVIQIRVDHDGIGMVFFDKPITGGSPTCINSYYNNALSFNSNTAGGKGILSVALAAKAMSVSVVAYGTGFCKNFGDAHVEDMAYLITR